MDVENFLGGLLWLSGVSIGIQCETTVYIQISPSPKAFGKHLSLHR